MTDTRAALTALTDLTQTARLRAQQAGEVGAFRSRDRFYRLARDLDATRTRLVQDGPTYLDAAWAFIDEGRVSMVRFTGILDAGLTGWRRVDA